MFSISDNIYKFGDQATFVCNEGYDLIGDVILTCTENEEFDK